MKALVATACLLLAACSTVQSTRGVLCANDWVSFDGKTMPWRVWSVPSGSEPKGIVIAVHGLSGATSDFWPLGEHLANNGITTYAYELRGQGNDPVVENRGDIDQAETWLRDLSTFHRLLKRRHPRTPVYWYGESLGSLITMHAAAHQARRFGPDALILATPIAGLRTPMSGLQRWLLETASAVVPRTRYSLGELAGVDESNIQVTSNTTHGGQMSQTPHHVSEFTLRLLTAIGSMMDDNPAAAAKLRMPVLFLASPNDILSSADQIQTLFRQVRTSDKKLLWFTRSHHLLLHDVQRAEVVNDVTTWLRDRR